LHRIKSDAADLIALLLHRDIKPVLLLDGVARTKRRKRTTATYAEVARLAAETKFSVAAEVLFLR
jgi:hypothetical protein